jgi:HK97 family phage major capsid protein
MNIETRIQDLKRSKSIIISNMSQMVIANKQDTNAYRNLESELQSLEESIEACEKLASYQAADERDSVRNLPTQVASAASSAVRDSINALYSANSGISADERRHKSNLAMRSFLLNGRAPNLPEQRDLLTTTDGTGGALIPQAYDDVLLQAQKYYAPLLQYVKSRRDRTGNPVKASWVNDTANGMTIIAEGVTTLNEGPDPVFHSQTVQCDLFNAGYIRVARELIADSHFDFGQLISDLGLTRYYRGLETVLSLGKDSAGNATPNNPGILSAATVGATTTALANGIAWSDITSLFSSLDKAYRPSAVWQFNSATELYLLQQKDSTSRPYFTPDPSTGGLTSILGKPCVVNEQLGNVGTANAVPLVFGSLQKGYFVKMDESPIVTRLSERFADLNEVAFQIGCRVGSCAMVPNTIKSLVLAAS